MADTFTELREALEKARVTTMSHTPVYSSTPNRVEQASADPSFVMPEAEALENPPESFVFPSGLTEQGNIESGPYMKISCYKYRRGYRELSDIDGNASKEKYYTLILPLPQTIAQEYSANMEQFEGSVVFDAAQQSTDGYIGSLASSAFGAAAMGAAAALKDTMMRFSSTAGGTAFQSFMQQSGAIRNLASTTNGFSLNPRYEMAFNSMQIRQHSFDFNLVPKSAEEARIINRLTRRLRLSSHPTPMFSSLKMGLTYPDEFVITFHDQTGKPIQEIPYIPDCMIKDLGITHTTGRLHDQGSPIATRIAIQFQELQLLDRDEIKRMHGDV